MTDDTLDLPTFDEPEIGPGHNNPPPETGFPRVDELLAACDRAPETVPDDATAAKLIDLVCAMKAQEAALEDAKAAEERPHKEALDGIRARFAEPLEKLENGTERITAALAAYDPDGTVRGTYNNKLVKVERESWEVRDPAQVPERFLTIDKSAVSKALKAGETIPGIDATVKKVLYHVR